MDIKSKLIFRILPHVFYRLIISVLIAFSQQYNKWNNIIISPEVIVGIIQPLAYETNLKNRLYQVLVILLLLVAVGGIALLFYGYYMSVIIAEMTSEGLNSSITNFYNTQLESFCIDSEQENIEGL